MRRAAVGVIVFFRRVAESFLDPVSRVLTSYLFVAVGVLTSAWVLWRLNRYDPNIPFALMLAVWIWMSIGRSVERGFFQRVWKDVLCDPWAFGAFVFFSIGSIVKTSFIAGDTAEEFKIPSACLWMVVWFFHWHHWLAAGWTQKELARAIANPAGRKRRALLWFWMAVGLFAVAGASRFLNAGRLPESMFWFVALLYGGFFLWMAALFFHPPESDWGVLRLRFWKMAVGIGLGLAFGIFVQGHMELLSDLMGRGGMPSALVFFGRTPEECFCREP